MSIVIELFPYEVNKGESTYGSLLGSDMLTEDTMSCKRASSSHLLLLIASTNSVTSTLDVYVAFFPALKMFTTTAHYEMHKLIKIGCMQYVMFGATE